MVDTNYNPPRIIMQNSVYEIAHCGVDVSKPRLFTCIVGKKGEAEIFFCHVFKCDSKETASKITRAVAQVCTQAYQEHQKQQQRAGGGAASPTAAARAAVMAQANKKPTSPAGAGFGGFGNGGATPAASPAAASPRVVVGGAYDQSVALDIVEQRRQMYRRESMKAAAVKTQTRVRAGRWRAEGASGRKPG